MNRVGASINYADKQRRRGVEKSSKFCQRTNSLWMHPSILRNFSTKTINIARSARIPVIYFILILFILLYVFTCFCNFISELNRNYNMAKKLNKRTKGLKIDSAVQ